MVSKETLIPIGGPAMMIGSVLWVLSSLSQFQEIHLNEFDGYTTK